MARATPQHDFNTGGLRSSMARYFADGSHSRTSRETASRGKLKLNVAFPPSTGTVSGASASFANCPAFPTPRIGPRPERSRTEPLPHYERIGMIVVDAVMRQSNGPVSQGKVGHVQFHAGLGSRNNVVMIMPRQNRELSRLGLRRGRRRRAPCARLRNDRFKRNLARTGHLHALAPHPA